MHVKTAWLEQKMKKKKTKFRNKKILLSYGLSALLFECIPEWLLIIPKLTTLIREESKKIKPIYSSTNQRVQSMLNLLAITSL